MKRTRAALLNRLERATAGLYHLATPRYPRAFGPYADAFDDWLEGEADAAFYEVNAGPVAEIFGRVYSWGRGGRTAAPDSLVEHRGGGAFRLTADRFAEWNAARLTEAVQVLESFAADVAAWNSAVPARWDDYTRDRAANESAWAAASVAESRGGVRNLLSDWRKIRDSGVEAPAVCAALRSAIAYHRARMAAGRATLAKLAPTLALTLS